MKRLRVLVVTRRYWPHVDDATCRLVTLVAGLKRAGIHVSVATPRYATTWPMELDHCEVPVFRPVLGPRGDWSMSRYVRNFAKWMQSHLGSFDLVYCDQMREEAVACSSICRQQGIPMVARCGMLESDPDVQWQSRGRASRRVFAQCAMADAIVAPRATTQQALLSAGIPADRIVRISDGVGPVIRQSQQLRRSALGSLAEINADLCVPIEGRVILCASRLSSGTGALELARHAGALLQKFPNDRLWFIGDGPLRMKVYSELKQAEAQYSAFLPGSFDHADELMQAASVFVLPSVTGGLEYYWPSAISAAVPSVVIDSPETRGFAGSSFDEISSFRSGNMSELLQRIGELLEDLHHAQNAAATVRGAMTATVPFSETVSRHVQLFDRLASGRVSTVAGATG